MRAAAAPRAVCAVVGRLIDQGGALAAAWPGRPAGASVLRVVLHAVARIAGDPQRLRSRAVEEDTNLNPGLGQAFGQQLRPFLCFPRRRKLQGLQPVRTLDEPAGSVPTHVQQDLRHAATHVPRQADLETGDNEGPVQACERPMVRLDATDALTDVSGAPAVWSGLRGSAFRPRLL